MESVRDSHVTLAVLAGGEGSRMGRSKALLTVNGRPILQHLHERFAWPGPTLLVTAPGRERPPGAEHYTHECVDRVAAEGPLRGVLTALENTSTPLVLVTAVDMPLLERSHLSALVAATESRPDVLGLVPARVCDGRRQVEPFPSIFHGDAIPNVRRRIEAGRRAVHELVSEDRFVALDVDWEPTAWLNLNHPADLPSLTRHGLRVR